MLPVCCLVFFSIRALFSGLTGVGGGRGSNEPVKNINLLIIGLDAAGKTSLTNNIKGESDTVVLPTNGLDVDNVNIGTTAGNYDVKLFGLGGGAAIR